MKNLILSICLTALFGINVFSCSLAWLPFCDHIDHYENVFSGVISANSDKGITIELLEVFKGLENRASITVWDGYTGDCNGIPETSFAWYYGNVGDTIIFALGDHIVDVVFGWEVVGDYWKPVNYYNYPDLWNPEFFKVENNQVIIEQAYGEPFIYAYEELVTYLTSGECISNTVEPVNCDELTDPLSLPWLQDLINGVNQGYGSLLCVCNDAIIQYCYNNEVYFDTTPLISGCADNQSYIFDINGNVVCLKGGFAGGGYCLLPEGYGQGAELVGVVWSCNENCGCLETILSPVCGKDGNVYRNDCFAKCAGTDVEKEGACNESLCSDFAFINTAVNCDPGCGDYLEFELVGGDGNYVVENGGIIVSSGDPVVYIFPGNNSANLTAIDGNGCLTEVAIPAGPCSVPPRLNADTEGVCIGGGLFTVGVRIIGNAGNYLVGVDEIGEEVIGSPGDLVYITLSSSDFENRVEIINLENDCVTNAFLRLQNPNCGNTKNNCAVEDLLIDLPWLAELIENADGCEVGSVEQFSYNGSDYIKVNPYAQFPYYYCPTDLPIKVYDCTGDLVCTIGGYGLQLKQKTGDTYFDECDADFTEAANNATLLWTYSEPCENPLELELVQNAINSGCTEVIYAFEINNTAYVYINNTCDDVNILHNCITGESCTLTIEHKCNLNDEELNEFITSITQENIIWSKPCNYENTGTITWVWGNCPADCSHAAITVEDELPIIVYNQSILYDFENDQTVEFTYATSPPDYYWYSSPGYSDIASIICIRAVDEPCNCTLQYLPVCGTDGLTYGNACAAECAGVEIAYEGECNNCADPLELELVQNAMKDNCVAAIYAFNYQNESYIYVDQLCEAVDGSDILYNCTTDETCYIGGFGGYSQACLDLRAEIDYLITEENIIWSSVTCNYEYTGIVKANDVCNFTIELNDANIIYPINTQFAFYDGQQVELSFVEHPFYSNCENSTMAVVVCIREAGNNINLFEDYPWLNNLINMEACAAGTTITSYNYSESFSFIHIKWANGNGSLYFQDGTFYCSDAPGYSCLNLYNLTEPINSFTCEDNVNEAIMVDLSGLNCINDLVFEIELSAMGAVSGNYGIYNAYDGIENLTEFKENEIIVYEGDIADATNDIYIVYVYDIDLADVGARAIEINIAECISENNALFEKYIWLNSLINPENCSLSNKVTEYDFGFYSFIFIEDNQGGKLYFEDGTFYCEDGPNYSCLALYGFDSPTASWVCEDGKETCLVEDPFSLAWLQALINEAKDDLCGVKELSVFQYEGSTYFSAVTGPTYPYCPTDVYGRSIYNCVGDRICTFAFGYPELSEPCIFSPYEVPVGEIIWNYYQDDIFTTYPWLNTLVDPQNCNNSAIQVHAYGTYKFISIEDNEGINLYFQDGTFYCGDGPNYSCTELYGLETPEREWLCEGVNQKQADNLSPEKTPQETPRKIEFDVDFKTYPNPSNGQFTVEFNAQKKETGQLNIISLEGKLIQSIEVEHSQKQMAINLAGVDKGVYLLQLYNDNAIIQTQRIIIQ